VADVAYRFLPWVRAGLSAQLPVFDTLDGGTPGRARVPVHVTVEHRSAPIEVGAQLAVAGPGEVLGLDPRQVIRTDPAPNVTDFEPNFLVQVEFDRPELPWLFTPAVAGPTHQLRPWLVLVAVEEGAGVSLGHGDASLPALTIAPAAEPSRQLPDLDDSWAWAHAQVVTGPGDQVDDLLAARPERTAARLICPRRLDPDTAYRACVVPAFEAGRLAGLGLPPDPLDEAALRPAWTAGSDAPVVLPVYFSWRFATGRGGDFESFARALRARPLPDRVGEADVFFGAAGDPLPALAPGEEGAVVPLRGALRAPEAQPSPWPPATRAQVEQALREVVDLPSARLEGAPGGSGPAVTPPLYGRWLAQQAVVPADKPPWLRELNLDPRNRAVAGLATRIVQREQEPLMEQAWAQVGSIEEANRELRWAQLARAVRASLLHRHVEPLPPGRLLELTGTAHRRMRVGQATLSARVAASSLSDATVSTPFRRVVRPRGPLARRAYAPERRTARPFVEALDRGALAAEPPERAPDGLFGFARQAPARPDVAEPVRGALAAAAQAAARQRPRAPSAAAIRGVDLTDVLGGAILGRLDRIGRRDPLGPVPAVVLTPAHRARARRFRDAVAAAAEGADAVADQAPEPIGPALDVAALRAPVLARLDPEVTVPARVGSRIRIPPELRPRPDRDPLEEVMAAPTFPRPAWELVRDHFPEHMLPGLEHVLADTATLVETNPPFVEALLVGLNHEMARELLWREYPTDQRGSPFRRFWAPGGRDDVEPVHEWTEDGRLGENVSGETAGRLVLLVRGELLRRYPSTVIYAAPDEAGRPLLDAAAVQAPLFRGRMEPDVTFVGFDLTAAQARAGFWFVFEEQPTEPRFGLDVAAGFGDDAPDLTEWNDLSWGHLTAGAEELAQLSHIPLTALAHPPPPGPSWGSSSSAMASILAAQPARVCLRAADLLPPPALPPPP
jgi:hypothetical protein